MPSPSAAAYPRNALSTLEVERGRPHAYKRNLILP